MKSSLREEIENIIGGNIKIEGTVEDIEEITDEIIQTFEKRIDQLLKETNNDYGRVDALVDVKEILK